MTKSELTKKIVIAKKYIMPQLLEGAGLKPEQLIIDEVVWPAITRPLGYDMGIRTLQRTLQGAVRKAARIMVEKGYSQIVITMDNRKIFLPQNLRLERGSGTIRALS